jgi:membrane protease YdiL (CAAX protease family)
MIEEHNHHHKVGRFIGPQSDQEIIRKRIDWIDRRIITGITVLYLVAIVITEAITTYLGILPGMFLYTILLIGLINLYYFTDDRGYRQIFVGFVMIPLLRILSLVVPFPKTPQIIWQAMIGIPLLFGAAIAIHLTSLPTIRKDMPRKKWVDQLFFGLCGIPLGMAAFYLLKPEKIVPHFNLFWVILAAIILTFFSALTDEIIFRGIIQESFQTSFGSLSFLFSSILYAAMFLGTRSIGYILFFGFMGMVFAYWVQKSRSVWGAIIAHSLLNLVFFLFLPIVIR